MLPAALVEAVRAAPRGVAAFDADGTLWREDIGEAFLRHLVRLGQVTLPDGRDPYAAYEEAVRRDKASGYAYCAQLQAGLEVDRLDAEARRLAAEWVPPRLIGATGELLELCREVGHRVIIVSASPVSIVRAAAPLVGVDEFRAMTTRIDGGRYTCEIVPPVTYGQGKIAALGDVSLALAAGDSLTGDLAMLEKARVPVAVAPGALADEAGRRGWFVVEA